MASLALATLALTAATSLPAAAQSALVQSSCPAGPPVLQLGNPNPGDLLPSGDVIFSGVAFDPAATSGPGITSVDLFLGSRDTGGMFLGSAVPGTSTMSNPRAWQVKASLPDNANGSRDFVAYAVSSVTGQQTSVSVPVFIGASPTPTPSGTGTAPTPVPFAETTTSTCQGTTTTPAGASAGSPAFLQLPVGHAAPVLSLGNPSSGNVLPLGDLIIQGQAFDPAATSGSGIDSVELFLDSRDNGGMSLGSGVPGDNGASNARMFSIKASIPSSANGGHDFVAYAHSSITGQETVVSVPIFIGAAPTPTPRPKSS
jgi:hypothetical protein